MKEVTILDNISKLVDKMNYELMYVEIATKNKKYVLEKDRKKRLALILEESMNINQGINRLLYVLKQKGQIYKINSFQFYSEKNDKYSTKYQVLKKVFEETYNIRKDEIELVEKYKQDYECYSKIDLMKYLVEENRKGSEADEK